MKMARIRHFCELFHFYPILDCYKIRARTNFENPNDDCSESAFNNVICAKRIVPGLNRFYSGHFQNAPNIKTFFGYA